ncbi:hypothetical protein QS257_01700 [Terrilactibacillus sp. S3-3]|nr:hypothetical protein QS257_01700 [Terrilactibacillus sp. S3-3]
MLFYLEENSGFNASLAVKKLRKILFALPFIGTEISSCVYNCLSEMLGRKLFLKQEIIGLVCESLLESYRILNSNEKTDNRFEDWATLDAMYSLASLTKKYYSVLSSAKMKIPEEMLSLISMFKKDISPEVRNQWEE